MGRDSVRRIQFTLQGISKILQGSQQTLTSNLPTDARVIDCYWDTEHQQGYFMVQSDQWSEVAEGALIPIFDLEYHT